ncbi:MAG: pyridoxal phosphate-dependent aminotransferase [Chloroflexaceae bacterium]|nr:pyridoxal phosphate-dependent aminotransferase [Chloroflexaceae bacterium]
MVGRVAQMRKEGISVISFAQGEPDFATPAPIKAAAVEALEQNITRYTPAGGMPELRQAVAEQLSRDTGLSYTFKQVTVTSGAKEALYLALQAICDAGDEVIIPAPYWVSYVEQARLAYATPVIIDTDEASNFKLKPEQLAAALTPRTRMVILCSPSNPTGMVYTADELQALAEVLRPSSAIVITDEIYDHICYNNNFCRWLQVAPDFAERTLVINGASKTFAMTGWRIGYAGGPVAYIEGMRSIQSHSTTHPASIAQYASLKAFRPSDELDAIVAHMKTAFQERRDLMLEELAQIPGVSCLVPDGAFYVFPNITGLLNQPLRDGVTCATSKALAEYLLEKAHIAVVFGEAFGTPGYVRLSYAQDNASLREGMRRFREAVAR